HLVTRAVGGAGLVMVEATGVSPEGRISPADLGIWNQRQQQAYVPITDALKRYGAVPAIQLAHAGRKAATDAPWRGGGPLAPEQGGWQPVGPSAVAFDEAHPVPHELTVEGIDAVVADFAAAARRALAAGFQVVEVHGAHGYLLSEFLSPRANHRTDSYGGDFGNRARLPLRVLDAVREVWPDELPVLFRISGTDWLPEGEGWTGEDTVRLAKELLAHGVDLLDVSSGGNAPVKPPVAPGFQVPYAAAVKRQTDLPVAAVGLITEPRQAEEIVATGQADAVFLGRELLRNPYWPRHAARQLGANPGWPAQYARAG
ncbi:MAG: NADH:flavin oxidoreductase/NADH oxidase, partial [Micromonosporaceae bacterium]